MSRDRITIVNEIVSMAADTMADKLESELMIVEMRLEKYGDDDSVVARLRERIERTRAAIEVMREYEGCWT